MQILIIIAGTNSPSNSDMLADHFAEGAKALHGVTITKIYLKNLEIDHFSMQYYDPQTDQGEDFRNLEKAIHESAGVVIASPIWNFSVPGHLKNLIDRMGSFGLDAETRSLGTLKGKPFFLILTGGTPYAAWAGLQRRTVSHLPVSVRYFGGTVIGKHYEERCTQGKGKFGLVVDKRPASLASMKKKGKHFAEVAQTFAQTGRLPMKEKFLLECFRMGQTIKRKLGL